MIKNIRIKSGYILRELGGEFCLALESDTSNGALIGLPSINETGIYLWEKLKCGANGEELIEALMLHNDMEYEDAFEDVGEFLAKLINGDIIEYEK